MKISVLCLLLLVLAGCATTTTVRVQGVPPLNLNETGESTPVDVRIYWLKDDRKFMSVPFDQLWTSEKDALGNDLVGDATLITVFPASAGDKPKEIQLGNTPADARYVGLMGLFPKYQDKDERRVAVPVGEAGAGVFEFSGYKVYLKK